MTKAFMIIDFQNSVLQTPEAFNAHTILNTIQHLANVARECGHPVIYVQHNEVGPNFEYGTENWEFPSEIAPQQDDIIIHKQSCDAFRETDLLEYITGASIQKLYISGYATDMCVDTTVRRAAGLGINTTVFANAHTTRERPFVSAQAIIAHHNWLWQEFTNPGNPIQIKQGEGRAAFED